MEYLPDWFTLFSQFRTVIKEGNFIANFLRVKYGYRVQVSAEY